MSTAQFMNFVGFGYLALVGVGLYAEVAFSYYKKQKIPWVFSGPQISAFIKTIVLVGIVATNLYLCYRASALSLTIVFLAEALVISYLTWKILREDDSSTSEIVQAQLTGLLFFFVSMACIWFPWH